MPLEPLRQPSIIDWAAWLLPWLIGCDWLGFSLGFWLGLCVLGVWFWSVWL